MATFNYPKESRLVEHLQQVAVVKLIGHHQCASRDAILRRRIQRDSSANHYLPGCREFASPHPVLSDQLDQGECIGMIETLVEMSWLMPPSFQSCTPNGVTNGQMVTVVVRWLDQHPQRWNESFQYLALEALREAWPCKNP